MQTVYGIDYRHIEVLKKSTIFSKELRSIKQMKKQKIDFEVKAKLRLSDVIPCRLLRYGKILRFLGDENLNQISLIQKCSQPYVHTSNTIVS